MRRRLLRLYNMQALKLTLMILLTSAQIPSYAQDEASPNSTYKKEQVREMIDTVQACGSVVANLKDGNKSEMPIKNEADLNSLIKAQYDRSGSKSVHFRHQVSKYRKLQSDPASQKLFMSGEFVIEDPEALDDLKFENVVMGNVTFTFRNEKDADAFLSQPRFKGSCLCHVSVQILQDHPKHYDVPPNSGYAYSCDGAFSGLRSSLHQVQSALQGTIQRLKSSAKCGLSSSNFGF